MEANLFRYIWKHSKREQVAILFLVLVSLPFYFLSLNLPKDIVNRGIQGQGFTSPSDTDLFGRIVVPFGEALFGRTIVLFEGFQLQQTTLLLTLSFIFLGLVIVNGLFKFVINTAKGRMGERMLRRLRYELTDRVLRFPLPQLRKVKQAEMATMVKDEVEPLGGFIGDAFVQPAFLGGQALTAMIFIMAQSFWLGGIALAIVLLQAGLIPRLRIPILRLGKQRQLTARQLAGRVGELVDGGVEIHAHDTSNFERADISARLGKIFDIRYEIFRRKFFVKFLNNFLSQVTPFIFYSLGGYLAVTGSLDIGALVAVIAAYKDLPGPVKELIDWDQQRQDVQIKYDQVTEQFQPPVILPPERHDPEADPGLRLQGTVELRNVTVNDDGDTPVLQNVEVTLPIDRTVAIVGTGASGKSQLAQVACGLLLPVSGHVFLDGRDTADLPEAVTGRRTAYVGPDAYLFPGSVGDALLYGLKHRPMPANESKEDDDRNRRDTESRAAGNPIFDIDANWIDYDWLGVADTAELKARMIDVLRIVDLDQDVYRFGLSGTIDPEVRPQEASALLEARRALADRLSQTDMTGLVESFDPAHYNRNATLAENLLFGTPVDPAFQTERLAENALVDEVLRDVSLNEPLIEMGASIARTMVEIFADLPPGHPFFEQFSFIEADELPTYRSLVSRIDNIGLQRLSKDDRLQLKRLPFGYVEARHRLELIDEEIADKVGEARRRFAKRLPEECPGAVEVYDPERYNAAASLQDNILFGRIAYGRAQAVERVGEAIAEVLDGLDLRSTVIDVGLGYEVGVAGKRLAAVQRQKIALGRAVLKQPDLLVVDQAIAIMDGLAQSRVIDNVLTERGHHGVIWVLHRATQASRFDQVVSIKAGHVAEQGRYDELAGHGGVLDELIGED